MSETIVDIVSEMRLGPIPRHRTDRELLASYADRLDAAHKREIAALEAERDQWRKQALEEDARANEATTEKSSPVGNAAAMREALEAVLDAMECGYIGAMGDCPSYSELEEVRELTEKMNAALAAPQRNCDVGTAEEQEARFGAFCEQHSKDGARGLCDERCPILTDYRSECALRWAQKPYEEGGKK